MCLWWRSLVSQQIGSFSLSKQASHQCCRATRGKKLIMICQRLLAYQTWLPNGLLSRLAVSSIAILAAKLKYELFSLNLVKMLFSEWALKAAYLSKKIQSCFGMLKLTSPSKYPERSCALDCRMHTLTIKKYLI
jgi:hypothetical protein